MSFSYIIVRSLTSLAWGATMSLTSSARTGRSEDKGTSAHLECCANGRHVVTALDEKRIPPNLTVRRRRSAGRYRFARDDCATSSPSSAGANPKAISPGKWRRRSPNEVPRA